MLRYCLDSNCLIEPKNGPYAMDFFPAFWEWLSAQFDSGMVYSVIEVYNEIEPYGDRLSRWVADRSQHFLPPSPDVQREFSRVASWVSSRYPPQHANPFLDRADPWLVAQAMVDGSVVVTQEVRHGHNNWTQPKIPNTCDHFGVPCMNLFDMLRQENVRFVLASP